jgi:hypothetical protein
MSVGAPARRDAKMIRWKALINSPNALVASSEGAEYGESLLRPVYLLYAEPKAGGWGGNGGVGRGAGAERHSMPL